MSMAKLYSDSYQKVSKDNYKKLVGKLNLLTSYFYRGKYELVKIDSTYIGICFKVVTGTGSASSIKRCEPVMVAVSPYNVEDIAPEVYPDRLDFDFCTYPHINPGLPNHRSLCLTRENFNDWYAEHTFEDMLQLIHEWFKDAARGGLIKYKNGDNFEPVTITSENPMLLIVPGYFDKLVTQKAQNHLLLLSCELDEGKPIGYSINIYKKNGSSTLIAIFYDGITDKVWNGSFPKDVVETRQKLIRLNFTYKINQLERTIKSDNNIVNLYIIRAIKRPVNILGKGSNIDYMGVFTTTDAWKNNSKELVKQVAFIERNSKEQASYISGTNKNLPNKNLLILGCGAIGSRLCENLYKAGITNLTVCDNDNFYWHNVYRHNLTSNDTVNNKAEREVAHLKKIYYTTNLKDVNKDAVEYLRSINSEELRGFDAIIDTTASARVFRNIDKSPRINKKKLVIRYALSNKGNIGLIYVKVDKTNNLGDFYYYILYCIINNRSKEIDLEEWVKSEQDYNLDQVRIGEGCHSATMILSDDIITTHTGLASLFIKRILSSSKPIRNSIFLSQINTEKGITCKTSNYKVEEFYSIPCHGESKWEVRIIKTVLEEIRENVFSHHKKETGGYLLGSIDEKHSTIYVLDTFIPADNVGNNTSLKLGTIGWEQYKNKIATLTSKQVYYIGDWHSHPKGGLDCSNTDIATFHQLMACQDMPDYILGIITNGRDKKAYLYHRD